MFWPSVLQSEELTAYESKQGVNNDQNKRQRGERAR